MRTTHSRKKSSKGSTLTIRIDERLKCDVIAIARESGEDISTWIRRFFEGIRSKKDLSGKHNIKEGHEDLFTQKFIAEIIDAGKHGSFEKFNLQDYV